MNKQALRVGIGGPVGSGKTALTLALCQALREQIDMAVVTNDIYTAEDAKFLVNHSALAPERIIVTAGGKNVREPMDHGFMYERSIQDLDGHIWEFVWMDPAFVEQNPQAADPAGGE